MTKFTIARAFDHKAHGRIGLVNVEADVKSMTIDGKELPAQSIEYLLTFALQSFQDAYAGAESADDAKGRFAKKLDRVIAGTIGLREAGDGASAETRMIRTVLGDMLRQAGKWKEIIGVLEENERAAKLDEIFAKQPEAKQAAIRASAAERLAELEAKRKQAAKLADGIEL